MRCSAGASIAGRAFSSLGPAGTGKSLLALNFVAGAIERGEKAACLSSTKNWLLFERANGLGIDLQAMIDSGQLLIEQMDAAEVTPGRAFRSVSANASNSSSPHGRDRQPERISGGNARGAGADPAHA